jgi:hypothetical protein
VAVALLAGAKAAAPEATPTTPDPVRVITERNIFNPARTPRSSAADGAPSAPPSPVAEVLTLVGVLDDGQRRLAFFDGTTATLRQALKVGGTVAGVTVGAIDLQQASLTADGQTFVLRVGNALAREPGGPWRAAPEARIADSPAGPAPTTSPSSTSSPSDSSDALRRLKERRRKQLKE